MINKEKEGPAGSHFAGISDGATQLSYNFGQNKVSESSTE